jgi:hypothetical protein
MSQELETDDRNANGTFAQGNTHGRGRPPGSRNKARLAMEALLEGEHDRLIRTAIDKALDGDTAALRLCLDRLAPVPKDAPVVFDLPPIAAAADAVAASAALLGAVAAGEVTPREAGRVMALLASHRALVETGDLERRVEALEATSEAEAAAGTHVGTTRAGG